MVGDYRELISFEVSPHVPDPPDHGQALELGRAVIPLGAVKRAARVRDDAFSVLEVLCEYGPYAGGAGVGLQ